jgi:hypothetical protein
MFAQSIGRENKQNQQNVTGPNLQKIGFNLLKHSI